MYGPSVSLPIHAQSRSKRAPKIHFVSRLKRFASPSPVAQKILISFFSKIVILSHHPTSLATAEGSAASPANDRYRAGCRRAFVKSRELPSGVASSVTGLPLRALPFPSRFINHRQVVARASICPFSD